MIDPSADQLATATAIITDSRRRYHGGDVVRFKAEMNFPEMGNLSLEVCERDADGDARWVHYEIGPDGELVQEPVELPS